MSAKTLKICLSLFAIAGFSGCGCKPVETVRYVDRPYEVKVPVSCVVPSVSCDANQSTYTGIIKEMRLCIERYKEAAEVCVDEAKTYSGYERPDYTEGKLYVDGVH